MKLNQKGATHLLLLAFLIIGLVVGIYLVSKGSTNTKTKASASVVSAFEIRDGNGKEVTCTKNTTDGVPICETETLDFTIAVKDPKVLQSLPN